MGENGELADQLATGGKSLYEVGKAKKKAEADYEEMKSALEEAEGALELEESRVLRLQLELAAAKADVDKKLAEKDEEFEATKKNHGRALESMQATLDVEVKARSDAHKAKKSLEAANADLEMQYDVLSKNFADAGKNYKDLQDENDAAGVAYSELKDQYAANERKYGLLFADYEEIKGTLDANDRTRKAAADELANLTDAYQTLTAQNAALSSAKRKLESEHEVMHNDWEDATAAAKSAEDAAKKALADAAKLSEDWKAQGNTVAALKAQYDALNADYEAQGKDYANLNKNFRKQDRKMKELAFQADEDAKNNTRMQELVSKLQGKLKQYKLQSEEAEALANDILLKYRRALNESSAAEERADAAEAALNKMRLQARH